MKCHVERYVEEYTDIIKFRKGAQFPEVHMRTL